MCPGLPCPRGWPFPKDVPPRHRLAEGCDTARKAGACRAWGGDGRTPLPPLPGGASRGNPSLPRRNLFRAVRLSLLVFAGKNRRVSRILPFQIGRPALHGTYVWFSTPHEARAPLGLAVAAFYLSTVRTCGQPHREQVYRGPLGAAGSFALLLCHLTLSRIAGRPCAEDLAICSLIVAAVGLKTCESW